MVRTLGLVGLCAALVACSDSVTAGPMGTHGDGGPGSIVGPGAGGRGAGTDAGVDVPRDGGGVTKDGATTTPPSGTGTGGKGGPAAGEHDVTIAGSSVALHVPASVSGTAPVPIVILLHGQGDTGRNFLNVWLGKGLANDVLLAAPDQNDDEFAMTLEQQLRSLYDVDTKREYVLGFSQGGGYAAFLLFDATVANRFAAIALASSGLAENPAYIPAATPGSPAVAVVIDPQDPNNTWNQGLHVMEDFVGGMQAKGYAAQLWKHSGGHTLEPTATAAAVAWMFSKTK